MTLYMGNNLVAGGFDMVSFLDQLYPVGSVYLTTSNANTCPLQVMGVGTWTLESNNNRALWVGNGSNGGTTIAQSLPNITGTVAGGYNSQSYINEENSGAFTKVATASRAKYAGTSYSFRINTFNASNSNSIYGNSTTVQPPAYVVNVWRRTA